MIKTFWAKKLAQEKSAKFMKIFELYQVFMHNFLSQNVLIPPNHRILTSTKTIFTTSTHFPTLSVKRLILFLFSHLLAKTNPAILLDAALQALVLAYILFKCFYFFKFVTPRQNVCPIVSGHLPKAIIMIKVSFIKIYTKNTHFICKKCGFTKIFIKKEYIILASKASIHFSSILLVTKQQGVNFNTAKESSTASSQILYFIYQDKIFRSKFITHFLSFLSIGNRMKYIKTNINSFVTYFLSLIAFKNKSNFRRISINPNLGWLCRGSFRGGRGEISSCQKLVRIMVETWNLLSKYTYVVSEYISFSTEVTWIFFIPALFCKKSAFFNKNSIFSQNNSVRAVLEIF